MAGCKEEKKAFQSEEVALRNKYGCVLPKKPLISTTHERAYFDSADWVLGMQEGASPKSKNVIESLKPKWKRTPHHQVPPRKPTCTSGEDGVKFIDFNSK